LILEVIEKMGNRENLVGLIASTLNRQKIEEKLTKTKWDLKDNTILFKNGTKILIAEGKFGDVCLRSKIIIGLAGIANEQAAGFGKPVFCFVGSGPQTTLRRWQEIQKITGKSMEIISGSAEEKAGQIINILHSPNKMEEMVKVGKESKKDWGACERIAKLIVS
jgi:uncharacterized protein (TIGR03492 family)